MVAVALKVRRAENSSLEINYYRSAVEGGFLLGFHYDLFPHPFVLSRPGFFVRNS